MKMHYTLFLLWLIVSACTFQDHHIPNPDPEVETIYVAGYQIQNGVKIATLWKNGIAMNLTDGSRDAEAVAVTINGTDVYVAGKERIAGNRFMAKYWKNGAPVNLSDQSQDGSTRDVLVVGDDVYVSGYVSSSASDFVRLITGYWKNGVFRVLSSGSTKLTVYKNDLYISGYTKFFQSDFGYWKNDQPVVLYPEYSYAAHGNMIGIAVVNDNVYVSGHVNYANGPGKSYTIGHYWKNDQRFRLEGNAYNEYIEVSDLAVDQNEDVYVSGFSSTRGGNEIIACLWKNTVRVPLEQITGSYTYPTAVTIQKSRVYVVGTEHTPTAGLTLMRAVYWKDGMKKYVDNSGAQSAAYAIIVTSTSN